MDQAAMARRCASSRLIGQARLARHRFALMADGHATIVRHAQASVHGLLYDLALADVGPLDRYEEVARGLYAKLNQPVLRVQGGPVRALVYVGTAGPAAGAVTQYQSCAAIAAAARMADLPPAYVAFLESLIPGAQRGAVRAASGKQG